MVETWPSRRQLLYPFGAGKTDPDDAGWYVRDYMLFVLAPEGPRNLAQGGARNERNPGISVPK